MNNLLRATLYVLAGKPLPPRCAACKARIWGGNHSDMRAKPRHWHPHCLDPQEQP